MTLLEVCLSEHFSFRRNAGSQLHTEKVWIEVQQKSGLNQPRGVLLEWAGSVSWGVNLPAGKNGHTET
jgi:hypothetical protein